MKTYSIAAAAAVMCVLSVPAVGAAQQMPTVFDPGVMLYSLSDNGAYAIGPTAGDTEVDAPHGAGGILIDVSSQTQRVVSAPSGWAEVNDVADNGVVVGSEAGRPGYWDPATDAWTTFAPPAGKGGGCFTAVTPDARFAVGYFFDVNNEFEASPMYYDLTTGQQKEISNLPPVDLSGLDQHQNVFYGISPDGRYVLGQMSQSYLLPVALFSYVYDTSTDTWKPIGYTYNPSTYKFTPKHDNLWFVDNQAFSTDGAWVTGTAYMVFGDGDMSGGSEGYYPYRYNVLTDAFEVYATEADEDIAGNRITCDGIVLGSSPAGNPYPTAQIRCGKYFISLDQVFEQVYGVTNQQLIGDPVSGAFQGLSSDGLTAIMRTYDNSYILHMPEPFVEAAAKVDLLAHYSLNIPAGSAISQIGEVTITFDRAIECRNYPQSIKLIDAEGHEVRSASGFSVSVANSNKAVVTFRSTALTPGEEYTVKIPSGMVWLASDPSMKAKEINIKYVGRNQGPVQLRSISPENGSPVTRFNSNPDFITATFDAPVAVTDTAKCTLYNIDDNSKVADFSCGASGNQAGFFPLSTYYLYKGSNYRVVISAGSVTDLSGKGPNEEIVLDYTGNYVRELSADDKYIFESQCEDYNTFIFWQSEFNEPGPVPQSWGFTAENMWLLVRDGNEDPVNWCMSAHSMFNSPAESDDWLIVPQLYIPDPNVYLSFDAQSYLRSKDDVLKVYIYEDNAVYNYFTMDLENAFKSAGDLVMEDVIPAGATDEGLSGEWSHYNIDLAPYAGKNIYIAFVNNNFDKSAIFLDNIRVVREMDFMLTNTTPDVVVDAADVKVKGILTVASEIGKYDGVKLTLADASGNVVAAIDDSEASLKYGDTYNFEFPTSLPLTVGEECGYTITVATGDITLAFDYKVSDLMFEPVKKVVLEEYTGSACGNCPMGILAIEYLQNTYPDNFIPVTLRAYEDDIYGAPAVYYAAYLGMNAAPTARINRGELLSPMLQNGSQGYTFYGNGIVMSDGNEAYLWADAVQDALEVPALAQVSFSVDYNAESGALDIPVDVRFALNMTEKNYALFAVVLEDQLPALQLNYCNTLTDPIFGKWGLGGEFGQSRVTGWKADDVTRYVVNGNAFGGNPMPYHDFEAGNSYAMTLNAQLSSGSIRDIANCKVVVMLIDSSTGAVVNADVAHFGTSGIPDVVVPDAAPIYFNLQGMRIEHPQSGQVYIRVVGDTTEKVIFK